MGGGELAKEGLPRQRREQVKDLGKINAVLDNHDGELMPTFGKSS